MSDVSSCSNVYQSLDKLAEQKAAGKLLDPLDEQRLRDHQIRRLRRLWLKDQLLSEREPLLPNKKLGFFKTFLKKEESFWSSFLQNRTTFDFIGNKAWSETPKFLLYKAYRAFRHVTTFAILPALPAAYYFLYCTEMPVSYNRGDDIIYPGDNYIKARRADIEWDHTKASYKLKEGAAPVYSSECHENRS